MGVSGQMEYTIHVEAAKFSVDGGVMLGALVRLIKRASCRIPTCSASSARWTLLMRKSRMNRSVKNWPRLVLPVLSSALPDG